MSAFIFFFSDLVKYGVQCSEFEEGNSRVVKISSSRGSLFHQNVRPKAIPTESDDTTSTEGNGIRKFKINQ